MVRIRGRASQSGEFRTIFRAFPAPVVLYKRPSNAASASRGGAGSRPGTCTRTPSTQGCSITPTGDFNQDAAAQLACAANARLARFNCQQACAAKTQQALDGCTTAFNDCLEGCR